MIFSSPEFLVFFAGYFIASLLVPRFLHLPLLIFSSLVFYGWWKIEYVLIPVVISAGIFLFSKVLKTTNFSRIHLSIAIVVLLLPLAFFKYTNFLFGYEVINYALPVGISFITFTGIAYLIDYYRGTYRKSESFQTILGYIVFFPQLVAGPILRPGELISQIRKPLKFSMRYTCLGALIFAIGVFKKVFIADQIAPWVNDFYAGDIAVTWMSILVAVYGFSVQIYCDFSGYTDMATGVALALGVRLPLNFDRPYLSRSIGEFWRRWHMTLSRWFRDYVYIPLGGRSDSKFGLFKTLLITFGLSGLWHGAGLNFVAWGLITGLLIWLQRVVPFRRTIRLPDSIYVLLTFNLITVLWILFRDRDFYLLNSLADTSIMNLEVIGQNSVAFAFPIILILMSLILHPLDSRVYYVKLYRRIGNVPSLLFALFVVFATILFSTNSSAEFIYFDF